MSTSPALTASIGEAPSVPAGQFVWHELITPDPDVSKTFYGELLGWSINVEDMGPLGPYTMLLNDDVPVAGLVTQGSATAAPNTGWLGYATVPDLEAALRTEGTEVRVPATELPDMGRFAVIADPSGGVIAPYQSQPDDPAAGSATPTPGTFYWHEVMTPDPEQVVSYYQRLFGWSVKREEVPGMGLYWIFRRDGHEAAGAYQALEGQPAQWLCYIGVDDADAAAVRAAELGGHIVVAPQSVPDVGRFSILTDPNGSSFGLFGP